MRAPQIELGDLRWKRKPRRAAISATSPETRAWPPFFTLPDRRL